MINESDLKSKSGKSRILALDVIRGLSILGVLAVNADGFAAPQSASLKPIYWPYPNTGATAYSYWIMDTFFHDKFITLFSMLFGVSLYLVGGERSDHDKGRLLIRRLAILMCFALLHGFGIWWGDVLALYATTGFIMFFCRSWNPRVLLSIGATLYVAMALKQDCFAFCVSAPHLPDPGEIARNKAAILGAIATENRSWSAAYVLNSREYWKILTSDCKLIPQTLGLMMIGLAFFKLGFFSGMARNKSYALSIVLAVPAATITGWICWQTDVLEQTLRGGAAFLIGVAPVVALGYAALLVVALRTRGRILLAPLAATGRMAFTNYLTQSIIMTSIFFGGRGALMGRVNRPTLWIIVMAIWGIQLVWSSWWLARFEMGPFEWVWRCLTIGRRVSFQKQRV